jgi:glycerol-3-phosphate acyltransferase PlsY
VFVASTLIVAFVAGSIPFSQIAARLTARVDLRTVGSGTVSGTNLHRVAGFPVLAVAGVFEVAKGAVGPLLAGPHHQLLGAIAGGLAVAGHNWSPFLRGAGGRGISPALGALLVQAWPGTVVLLVGLIVGRLTHATGFGAFVADVALVPVTAFTFGVYGALAGIAVIVPLFAKRVLGNHPPAAPGASVYVHRLLFDQDPVLP